LVIFGVGFLLFTISLLAGKLIFHSGLEVFENLSSVVTERNIAFLKYVLISQDVSIFIIPAIIILFMLKPHDQPGMMILKNPTMNEIFLVILLAFCIFPITSLTGQLNSEMRLPNWLSGVENWMRDKENNATTLIDLGMASNTFLIMMLNVFVFALVPAIGEELIFRGVIQKVLSDLFRSGHPAIWVTAFVFSAIHFQFYGFIPRLILGLIFGYLFFWSGKIWVPVIAHFVNNAVPAIGVYLSGLEKFDTHTDIPYWLQFSVLPIAIVISLKILFYFRNKSKTVEERI
jgi:membrane protease YdiL (CAAX protease family)